MSEISPDQPSDHEAVIARYTPEMVEARDALLANLQAMRERAKAADIAGRLSSRARVRTYAHGATTIVFGAISDNIQKGLAQLSEDEILKNTALDVTGVPMPGSDSITIQFDFDKIHPDDPSLPPLEQPMLRIARDDEDAQGHYSLEDLSVYGDGYVETSLEVVRFEQVYPPGMPIKSQEVSVVSIPIHPAEVSDIQKIAAQIEGTMRRYNITL